MVSYYVNYDVGGDIGRLLLQMRVFEVFEEQLTLILSSCESRVSAEVTAQQPLNIRTNETEDKLHSDNEIAMIVPYETYGHCKT